MVWLLRGIYYLVGWIFRGVVIKFVFFTAIGAILLILIEVGQQLLDLSGISDIAANLGGLPADISFFIGLFQFQIGIPMILTAYLARFAIRRLPFIG